MPEDCQEIDAKLQNSFIIRAWRTSVEAMLFLHVRLPEFLFYGHPSLDARIKVMRDAFAAEQENPMYSVKMSWNGADNLGCSTGGGSSCYREPREMLKRVDENVN
ncbi:MAG: hypothetical protein UV79_C0003G0035 [candidate division TM6 bacterium GW2011_GWF2_43_17]|nr:MAG: hypothetical protein UV79_C0003G0035 [candidate division TM6 bacterium GW2011_GWF2_43_17]